jgi:hypothetical protein
LNFLAEYPLDFVRSNLSHNECLEPRSRGF